MLPMFGTLACLWVGFPFRQTPDLTQMRFSSNCDFASRCNSVRPAARRR